MSPAPQISIRLRQAVGVLWAARDRAALAWLAFALAAVCAGGTAAGLVPLALKGVVDHLQAAPAAREAVAAIGLLVLALLSQRLFEQLQAYAYGRGEQRLSRRLATRAFEHMLRLPLRHHLETRAGALAQVLAEGAMGLRIIIAHLVTTIAPVAVQLTVAGVVVGGLFSPATALVLVAALLAYAATFVRGVARQDGPARAVSAAQVEAGGLSVDGLMNVEAIKAFTAEARFANRYDDVLAVREAQWGSFLHRRFANGLSVGAIFGATVAASLLQARQELAQGALTLGGFVLLYAYILQLVRPVELLGLAARDIGQGLANLDRLLAVFAQPPESDPPAAAEGPPATGPAELRFEGVSFAFGPDRATLREISFRAAPGATVAVVGPSGAGKSSLLRLILRFYEPECGCIRLDGRPLSEIPLSRLRGQIAVVSQDTILFNDSLAENLRLAEAEADLDQLRAAADTARLTDLLSALPAGLETPVGERGLKLSGGEKQRVAIARAALRRARLVLFDEATAALDPSTEQAVWAAMGQLAGKATILVVTHRLATVTAADQILVLDGGRIAQRGRHRDLLTRQGLYARLWADQTPSGLAEAPFPQA